MPTSSGDPSARFTEDLDLKIEAAIEAASELPAAGFAVDAPHAS